MERGARHRARKGMRKVYRIVVRGELSERYAGAFEGMKMETRHGETIITGEVKDQPHLHGILDRISSLGLELRSVESLPVEPHDDESSHPTTADRSNWKGLEF